MDSYEFYKTLLISVGISKNEFMDLFNNLKKLGINFIEELAKKDTRPLLDKNDKFLESHEGHMWGSTIKNSYDIFEDKIGKYVRMFVGKSTYGFFDYEDFDKICYKKGDLIKQKKISWFIGDNGYISAKWENESNNYYMHHIVMDFKGSGKGFQEVSIDHKDRNPLNNRKSNLRLATAKEQLDNSNGILPGTKRNRKHNARPLPEGITVLPKYVVYYREEMDSEKYPYRDFFRIEKHPKQLSGQFKDKWATTKSMKVSIAKKLEEAVAKIKEWDALPNNVVNLVNFIENS